MLLASTASSVETSICVRTRADDASYKHASMATATAASPCERLAAVAVAMDACVDDNGVVGARPPWRASRDKPKKKISTYELVQNRWLWRVVGRNQQRSKPASVFAHVRTTRHTSTRPWRQRRLRAHVKGSHPSLLPWTRALTATVSLGIRRHGERVVKSPWPASRDKYETPKKISTKLPPTQTPTY